MGRVRGLTVQVDVDAFGRLDFDPRYAPVKRGVFHSLHALGHQRRDRLALLVVGNVRQHADVQETIVEQSLWAKHVTTACLACVAHGQHEELAFPV
jgi:hypothetical protein